ncbi:MAG: cytochrome c oxidase subunit 3 [Acidobacteriaceae bacterium]|nr:cytochrome c oxidase subunit 3 [Acidobacteriaceae bacterium]
MAPILEEFGTIREVQTVTETAARERDLNSLSLLTAIIILATVTMMFGAIITVFIDRSLGPRFWGHIHVPKILWATTTVLLASSALLEIARRRLKEHDRQAFFRFTSYAAVLGVLFLAGQLVAWFQILGSGVSLAANAHSWFIFLFTGLHGMHIVAGLAGLACLLVRTRVPAGGPKYQMTTRVVANGVFVFWHYLDFLWLLLFALLLAWRR